MKGTPLVALSLVSTFFVCAAAKNGTPVAAKPVTLAQEKKAAPDPVTAKVWTLESVLAEHRKSKRRYTRFFRVPSTHCGVYTLPKGGKDEQSPHSQDEFYYVVSGQATLQLGRETRPVKSGDLVYVAAGAPHHFTNIVQDLELLVIFSAGPKQPAATTAKNAGAKKSEAADNGRKAPQNRDTAKK